MKKIKSILSVILTLVTMATVLSVAVPSYAATLEAPVVSSYCNIKSKPVITWKKVDGAVKYRVYRASKKDGEFKSLKVVTSKSYTDNSAANHKTYYYKVRAYDKKGNKGKISKYVKQKSLKTVLVGDSIMSGLDVYKALPGAKLVYKVGVGPTSFLNYAYSEFSINGKSAKGVDKVISLKPDRVFIMLGMNEIAWSNMDTTVSNYKKALEKINKARPNAQIIVLANSPTAKKHNDGVPSNSKVNKYNTKIKALAKELDVNYYNYTAFLKNKDGYLKKECNGGDGCHWTSKATKTFASKLKSYCKTH